MTDIKQLFTTLCALLHAILLHPDCTKRVRQTLADTLAGQRNQHFKPAERPGGARKTLSHLLAITFGLQDGLKAAEISALTPPPPMDFYEQHPLARLFKQFGEVIAQILAHPDVTVPVDEALSGLLVDITETGKPEDTHPVNQMWARLVLPAYLNMLAGIEVARAQVLVYAPEVEARRMDYERLAESWVTLASIASAEAASMDLPGERTRPLLNAFHDHFITLVHEQFDWFTPHLMRHFYPEMRLAIDQTQWEAKQRSAAESKAA